MAEDYVAEVTCKERCERLEDADKRQNERLDQLERRTEEINHLAVSVKELATTMKQMLEEQKTQGTRIAKLEERDGQKWREAVKTVITVILTAAVTAALAFFGLK